MTSSSRDDVFSSNPEDRLPWLESADDEYREGPSPGRVIALILAALAIVALIALGYHWVSQRTGTGATGTGELIQAPPGDYKVKPDDPGGMKVDGEGDSVFATSAGSNTMAAVDTSAVPEAPIKGRTAPAVKPQDKGSAKVVSAIPSSGGRLTAATPVIATARPAPGTGGSAIVQLGSFPSEGGANATWAMLSKRFAYLAPLGKSVEKTEIEGKTFYRLRVNAGSAGNATAICGKLKVAGEPCFIPN